MNISKYTGFFHDGSLIDFQYKGSSIEILMASAEVIPEHMMHNMPPLNIEKRIFGKLVIQGVKTIKVNDELLTGFLIKQHDSGSILDFEIYDHKVVLGIEWDDYFPKPRKSDFSTIEIQAEKIWWENIPDLE